MQMQQQTSPEFVGEPSVQFTVTDVRQFGYCRRIPFFTTLSAFSARRRPVTFKMQEGTDAHAREVELAERRSLRAYGIREGTARFEVSVRAPRLVLSGRVDMVIESAGEVIPVDFKASWGEPGRNHKYQLTAYALLIEEIWGRTVDRGFIYLVPQKRAVEIAITAAYRTHIRRVLTAMRGMIEKERLPGPTEQRGRCVDCEFRRLCNDL